MTTDKDMTANNPGRLIGALLREARENIGMSVPEVSRALRIRQVYLEAIEADDYASLPGKTYVLGFLRSYAELLGLDADDVSLRYRRQSEYSSLPQSSLNFPIRDIESRMPRGAVIVLSLLLAGGAVYGGARYFGGDTVNKVDRVAPVPDRLIADSKPTPPPVPAYTPPRQDPASAYAAQMPQAGDKGNEGNEAPKPPPAAVAPPVAVAPPAPIPPATPMPQIDAAPPPQVAAAPTQPAAPPVAAPATPATKPPATAATKPNDKPTPSTQTATLPPKTEDPPAPKPRDVVVVARVDSWIEVRDINNRPLVSLLLRVGDSYRVPSGANYRLVTGDLRGLEVRVDGVSVPQKGTDDGRLHRTLSLDGDRLRAGSGMVE